MIFLLSSIEAAKYDAEEEADLAKKVPEPARPYLDELSQIAVKVAKYTENDDIDKSLSVWDEAIRILGPLKNSLPDPMMKDLVGNLLEPWMKEFRTFIASGKATPATIYVYYTMKNAVLNAIQEWTKPGK